MRQEVMDGVAIKYDKTMESLAEILREKGVDAQGYEGHTLKVIDCDNYPVPDRITFRGDDGTRLRAVKIVLENGYPLTCVNRHWDYFGEFASSPYWEMVFKTRLQSSVSSQANCL